MPTDKSVTLVKGTIPPGLCFTNIPELYSTFVDTTTAYVDGNYSLFNYGNQAPSADDIDKPWIKLDNSGRFDRVYGYADGYWLSPHPCPALGKERRIWTGTPEELKVYEDSSNTVEAADANIYTGPFWEVDTDLVPQQTSNKEYTADIFDTSTLSGIISNPGTGPYVVTQNHGLGELPDKVEVTLLCIEDDESTTGYAVGDEIQLSTSWIDRQGETQEFPTTGVTFNETNVILQLSEYAKSDLSRFYIRKKDNTDGQTSNQYVYLGSSGTKFKFRIRVWKKGGKSISTSSTNFSYIKRTRRVYYTG